MTLGTAVVVADTTDMERPEWLELRQQGIGGSDVAAIAGLNKWRSPYEVYLSKIGALDDDREVGEAAQWGNLLEGVVCDEFGRRKGLVPFEVNALLASPDRPWQLANVDRGVINPDGSEAILEAKTGSVYVADGWDDDSVPTNYVLQGQHYLAVTGLDHLWYAVLLGGQRLEIRQVNRDEALIDELISIEAKFWQRILDRNPPDPDGSKACTDLIGSLYEVEKDSVLVVEDGDVIENIGDLIARKREADLEVKAAEATSDEMKNRLKLIAGEHEIVTDQSGRTLFTWKHMPEVEVAATKRKAHRRINVPKER